MCDAFDFLSREKVMSYSSSSSKRRVPKMKHTTTLLWLFSLSKTTTRCMRAKALLLFYSSVRLVVAMTRVSRLRVETCLSFVVVVVFCTLVFFSFFSLCVCVCFEEEQFHHHPIFCFLFFFGLFFDIIEEFYFFYIRLSGQVFRYSSVLLVSDKTLPTRTNCT